MSVHMVWMESMMTRRGVLPSDSVAMMSSTEVSAASSTGASARPSRSARMRTWATALFAGDIDGAVTAARQRRHGLNEQCGFADPGIAAQQQHRAADKTAAGDAVEFSHARGEARGVLGLSGQRLELKLAALPSRPSGAGGTPADTPIAVALFDECIPLAAGLAFALPERRGAAAVLADVGEMAAGHQKPLRIRRLACRRTLSLS